MAHQKVGQGGTIVLPATFQEGDGDLIDPVNPFIDIIDVNNVELVSNAIPVHDGLGQFHYNYVVPLNAPLGLWKGHWSGIINGKLIEADDGFEVVLAGAIEFDETIRPTPAEVKALIPARLEGAAFANDTIPTLAQVEKIIDDIVEEVIGAVEVAIPETFLSLARFAVKMGAAAEIERSFWPEQHDLADTATYERLRTRYRELLEQLKAAIAPIEESDIGTIRIKGSITA